MKDGIAILAGRIVVSIRGVVYGLTLTDQRRRTFHVWRFDGEPVADADTVIRRAEALAREAGA